MNDIDNNLFFSAESEVSNLAMAMEVWNEKKHLGFCTSLYHLVEHKSLISEECCSSCVIQ